jgi:hypothetical protein
MIALAMLLCGVLAAQAPHEDAFEVHARLEAAPAEARIGEPIEWNLTIEAPAGVAVRLPDKDPIPDATWVALGERRVVHEGDTVRIRWRVLSLESGARKLPEIAIECTRAGVTKKVAASAGEVAIAGELASGEDAPRALKGFRPPPDGERALHWPWIAAGLGILAALATWIARRVRRRPLAPAHAATPLDRLADLARALAADPDAGRSVTYDLSRIVRDSVDAFTGDARAALTDGDWILRLENDERVPLGVRRASARILSESEQVKYAQRVPTRFAVDEMLRDAQSALEALAAAPLPRAGDAVGKEAA